MEHNRHTYNVELPKLSSKEFREIILNNLGFKVDHRLFTKKVLNSGELFKISIQAIIGGQLGFVKKIYRLLQEKKNPELEKKLFLLIKEWERQNEN